MNKLILFSLTSLFLSLVSYAMHDESGDEKNEFIIDPSTTYIKFTNFNLRISILDLNPKMELRYSGPSVKDFDPKTQEFIFNFFKDPSNDDIISLQELNEEIAKQGSVSGRGTVVFKDIELLCFIENSKINKLTIIKGQIKHENNSWVEYN